MWPAGGEQPSMAMGRRGPTRSSSAAAPASSSATTTASRQHSSWRPQSPVPYLFGGLAAMLGLIALSLLALACSYWKLAGEPDDAADHHQARRAGDGENKGAADGKTTGPAGDKWMEHVVVIMAGDEGPTFLATPASRRREDDGDDAVARGARGGAGSDSEQGRYAECAVRARPVAGVEDDALMNRSESEQSAVSSSGS